MEYLKTSERGGEGGGLGDAGGLGGKEHVAVDQDSKPDAPSTVPTVFDGGEIPPRCVRHES